MTSKATRYMRRWRAANQATSNATLRRSYLKHRGKRIADVTRRYRTELAWVNGLKAKPCRRCRKRFPSYVMEYHHVRGRKQHIISRMVGRNSREAILAEIAKCDLLCANCHRIRTFKHGEIRGKRGRPRLTL